MTGEWEPTAPKPPVVKKVQPKTPPPLADWLGKFNPKPGWSRPICSQCGEDWPCGYWADDLGVPQGSIAEQHLNGPTGPGTDGSPA